MTHIGFTSCKSYPDIWISPAHKDYVITYWNYLQLYMDDTLCIGHRDDHVLRRDIGK